MTNFWTAARLLFTGALRACTVSLIFPLMKKLLPLIAFALLAFTGQRATAASIDSQVCEAVRDWDRGLSSEEICRHYRGSNCSILSNKGQAICGAGGSGMCSIVRTVGEGICYALRGGMCSVARNTAQGICYAVGGSMCDTLSSRDDREWTDRFLELCN